MGKTNQDCSCAVSPVGGQDDVALFCVFDGHGRHGHIVSKEALVSMHFEVERSANPNPNPNPNPNHKPKPNPNPSPNPNPNPNQVERSAKLASEPAAALAAAFEAVQAQP